MNILVIWEAFPETTSFHLIPYQEKWLQCHGKFLGADDVSDLMAELIGELDRIKGDSTPSCDIQGLDVGFFVQTGCIL
jgi:hypothetical protein